MIEGLIWLLCSTIALCAVALVVPRALVASVTSWQHRHHEKPTPTVPSLVCAQCAAVWGPWSAVNVTNRANNPSWSGEGQRQIVSQTRTCTDCGFAERRVLG